MRTAQARHHGLAGKVLARDELNARPLAEFLLLDEIEKHGVVLFEGLLPWDAGWDGHGAAKVGLESGAG